MKRTMLQRGWLLAPFLVFLVATAQLDRFKSILLPALVIGTALVLIGIDMRRGARGVACPEPGMPWRKLLPHLGWSGGFVGGIYLMGMIPGLSVLLILYLRWLSNRWYLSIAIGAAVGLAIYGLSLAAELPLYRGLLFRVLSLTPP